MWSNGLRSECVNTRFDHWFTCNQMKERTILNILLKLTLVNLSEILETLIAQKSNKSADWGWGSKTQQYKTCTLNCRYHLINPFPPIDLPYFWEDIFKIVCCRFLCMWESVNSSKNSRWAVLRDNQPSVISDQCNYRSAGTSALSDLTLHSWTINHGRFLAAYV